MSRVLAAAAALIAATAGLAPAIAQRGESVRLPIAPGYYVWEGEPCGRTHSIFRYDGRRAGWYGSRSEEEGHQVGDIRRIWRRGANYVVQVTGQDAEGERQDGLVEIHVTLMSRGRIMASLEVGEDVEETPLRLCAPASLPRWARRF